MGWADAPLVEDESTTPAWASAPLVDEGVTPTSTPPAPREESSALRRYVADPAISLAKGVIGVPEAVTGLADIATLGRVGKALEGLGFRPQEAKAYLDTLLTQEQQEANKRVEEAEGFVDTVATAIQNPSTIGHAVVEALPGTFAGGAIGQVLRKGVPAVSPLVAGAAGEGAVSAGSTAEQIRQDTQDGVLTPAQAALAAGSGMATGALGVAGGKVAVKLGLADVDTLLAGGANTATKAGIIRRVTGGALAEGVFEELPQSIQEQIAQNVALGNPWDEGVDKAAAMGMLVGGAMGAGANVRRGSAAVTADPSGPPVDTGEAQGAPVDGAPPGASPAPEQGIPFEPPSVAEVAAMKAENMTSAPGVAPAPVGNEIDFQGLDSAARAVAIEQAQAAEIARQADAATRIDSQPIDLAQEVAGNLELAPSPAPLVGNEIDIRPFLEERALLKAAGLTVEQRLGEGDILGRPFEPEVIQTVSQVDQLADLNPAAAAEIQSLIVNYKPPKEARDEPAKPAETRAPAPDAQAARDGEKAAAVPGPEKAGTGEAQGVPAEKVKPARAPWEMTREEFEADAAYQGVNAATDESNPSYWFTDQAGEAVQFAEGGRGDGAPARTEPRVDVALKSALGAEWKDSERPTGSRHAYTGEKKHRPVVASIPLKAANDPHRYLVEQALREGKEVPASVLAQYPDLAGKARGTAAPAAPTIEKDAEGVYVARIGGREVGRVYLDEDGERIRTIRVDDDIRRKGVGRALYRFIEQDIGKALQTPTTETPDGKSFGAQMRREAKAVPATTPAVDTAAHEAATSPKNDLPQPTEAQKEAGNYTKGHARIAGMDVSIENPAGSKRRPEWPALKSHYGYIRRSEGADGDHVDAFVKQGTPEDFSGPVFVVDQVKANGKFDEHKVVLGAASIEDAKKLYRENYTKGFKVGPVTELTQEKFKAWLASPYTKRAVKSLATSEWKKIEDAVPKGAETVSRLQKVESEIGWAETGGRMIRETDTGGEKPEVVGRTSWVPKSNFWPERPTPKAITVAVARAALRKVAAGQRLSTSEQRFIDYAAEWLDKQEALTRAARAEQPLIPDPEDLEAADLTPADSADGMLVKQAIEIDESRVEALAVQFENDDAGFLAAVKEIVDGQNQNDEAAAPRQADEEARGAEEAPDRETALARVTQAAGAIRAAKGPQVGALIPELDAARAAAEKAGATAVQIIQAMEAKRRPMGSEKLAEALEREQPKAKTETPADAGVSASGEQDSSGLRESDRTARLVDSNVTEFTSQAIAERAGESTLQRGIQQWAADTKGLKEGEFRRALHRVWSRHENKYLRDMAPALLRDPAAPALELKGETESEIRTREAQEAKAAEEKKKRAAAPEPSGFTLTGSDRQADEAEARGQKPMFRRGSTEQPGLTPAQFKAAIAKTFGARVTEKLLSGVISPVAKQGDLPAHLGKYVRDGDVVYGVHDPRTDRVYAVLENLSPAMVRGLTMHEVGVHYGFEKMLGEKLYGEVMERLETLLERKDPDVRKARASAERESADPSQVPEETLAYLIQNRPDLPFIQRVIAAIKAFLFREFGIGKDWLNADDMAMLARAAVRHAAASMDAPLISTEAQPAWHKAQFARTRESEPLDFPGVTPPSGKPPAASKAGSPPTPPPTTPTAFHQANERLRERDKSAWSRARKYLRRQFAPGGLLPASVFEEKVTRDSQMNAVEFDVRHHVGRLEVAVEENYGKKFIALPQATKDQLSQALKGEVPAGLPTRTREAIYAMRQYIDGMSQQYAGLLREQANVAIAESERIRADLRALSDRRAAIENSEKNKDTRADLLAEIRTKVAAANAKQAEAMARASTMETILRNIGEYVHRSYQAFDDRKWFQKLDDATINAARTYLANRYQEDGDTATEAARKAEITLHEIVKSGTAYDSMGAFIQEGKLGAKDLTVLIRRKEIAPEIRALLGEYKDARLNYAKSATKMGRLIWNQRFLDSVRERGMGVFLFEGDQRPPDATKLISSDASESYAPLNGLWTFPDVEQGFRDALAKERMDQWYQTIVQLNGMVKFGKTILSPTTAARNWQSAFFFAVANGHFDMRHIAKSVRGLREYFTQQGEGAQLAYLRELQELGVIYDNPYAGEMMRLLGDSKLEDTLLRGADPMKYREGLAYAQKFYQYGDDFWKIVGFENEKNLLMKHAGMSEAEAKKEAAARVRNTYPTYSMVGRAMHFLRRFPLAGTFVSFPAEIIRTVGNMIRYTAQDFKNPRMRPLALRRMAGLSIASGFAYGLQAMSMMLLGIDDDDEEAIRDLAPTWSKNSNFLFLGRDDKGMLQYIDLSYVDPYNYFKRPATAILRDQPWEKIAASVFRETLEPFLGTDIAAGAIFEILSNKKESGGRVYTENDKPWRQTADIANHLRKSLQPGIAANLERTYKALAGEMTVSGKKYSPGEEAAGWAGWRVSTLDPKVALYYRTFEFQDALRDASSSFNRVARNPNDVTTADLKDALARSRSLREDAFREMGRIVSAAKSSGLSNQEIARILSASQVSRVNIQALLTGKVPPWKPTTASMNAATRRADALLGPEKRREFSRRYQEAIGLP